MPAASVCCRVRFRFWMNNIAGIFQVVELLGHKLLGSGIGRFVVTSTFLAEGEGKRLVKEFPEG